MNEKMVKTIKKIKSLCNSMSWIEKVGKERVVPFNSISNFAPTPVWNFSPVLILPYKLHQLFVNLPGYSSRMVTLLNPFLNVTNCKKVSTKEICRHSKLRVFLPHLLLEFSLEQRKWAGVSHLKIFLLRIVVTWVSSSCVNSAIVYSVFLFVVTAELHHMVHPLLGNLHD